jgi:hypothetical protein
MFEIPISASAVSMFRPPAWIETVVVAPAAEDSSRLVRHLEQGAGLATTNLLFGETAGTELAFGNVRPVFQVFIHAPDVPNDAPHP